MSCVGLSGRVRWATFLVLAALYTPTCCLSSLLFYWLGGEDKSGRKEKESRLPYAKLGHR